MDAEQKAEIREAVREVLHSEAGLDLGQLGVMATRVTNTERDVGLLADAVIGPIITDWRGEPDPDGQRHHKEGSAWRSEEALRLATLSQTAMDNGGIPARLSRLDRAALWGAGGSIVAAVITGLVLLWVNS